MEERASCPSCPGRLVGPAAHSSPTRTSRWRHLVEVTDVCKCNIKVCDPKTVFGHSFSFYNMLMLFFFFIVAKYGYPTFLSSSAERVTHFVGSKRYFDVCGCSKHLKFSAQLFLTYFFPISFKAKGQHKHVEAKNPLSCLICLNSVLLLLYSTFVWEIWLECPVGCWKDIKVLVF